ncbi:MAG: DUF3006 domain-containing protein [Candidatus Merdivicinus sp.]
MIIDRFEEEYAICEQDDGGFVQLLRKDLPTDCREGDILYESASGWKVDTEATAQRRADMAMRMRKLWK